MLHPYTVFAGDRLQGAVLTFARTARDARRIGYPRIADWCDSYTDVRACRLRHHEVYLRSLGNAEKLANGVEHVIESLPLCPVCETWGAPFTTSGCENCQSEVT